MLKIKLSKSAELDIETGIRYYNRQRVGLGSRFLDTVKITFGTIKSMPHAASLAYDDVRYKVVDKFPYIVTYTIEDKIINIFRVFNTHLDPDKL